MLVDEAAAAEYEVVVLEMRDSSFADAPLTEPVSGRMGEAAEEEVADGHVDHENVSRRSHRLQVKV